MQQISRGGELAFSGEGSDTPWKHAWLKHCRVRYVRKDGNCALSACLTWRLCVTVNPRTQARYPMHVETVRLECNSMYSKICASHHHIVVVVVIVHSH